MFATATGVGRDLPVPRLVGRRRAAPEQALRRATPQHRVGSSVREAFFTVQIAQGGGERAVRRDDLRQPERSRWRLVRRRRSIRNAGPARRHRGRSLRRATRRFGGRLPARDANRARKVSASDSGRPGSAARGSSSSLRPVVFHPILVFKGGTFDCIECCLRPRLRRRRPYAPPALRTRRAGRHERSSEVRRPTPPRPIRGPAPG